MATVMATGMATGMAMTRPRVDALRFAPATWHLQQVFVRLGSAGFLALGACGASVQAQSSLTIKPRIGVTQTVSDNVALETTSPDAALITVLSPGVTINSSSGRIRGNLDYSLNGVLYLKSERDNSTQQALNAQGVVELVDDRVFIDTRATISQQSVSAFGQQAPNNSLANPNRSEVANLSVSPYWRGRILSLVGFELRGTASAVNTKDSLIGDSNLSGASLRIDGLNAGQLRWLANLSTQKTRFKASNTDNQTTLANVGLRYRPDVDLELGLNGGPERSNYLGGTSTSSNY